MKILSSAYEQATLKVQEIEFIKDFDSNPDFSSFKLRIWNKIDSYETIGAEV